MKLSEIFGSKGGGMGDGIASKGVDLIAMRKEYSRYAIAQAEQGKPAVKFEDYLKGSR